MVDWVDLGHDLGGHDSSDEVSHFIDQSSRDYNIKLESHGD